MQIRVDQHEMRRGAANFGASQHEPKVIGLGVLAPSFEAVVHSRALAHGIAAKTRFNAGSHFGGELMHGAAPWQVALSSNAVLKGLFLNSSLRS